MGCRGMSHMLPSVHNLDLIQCHLLHLKYLLRTSQVTCHVFGIHLCINVCGQPYRAIHLPLVLLASMLQVHVCAIQRLIAVSL